MGTSAKHFGAREESGAVWLALDVITDYFEGAWSLATGNLSPLSEQKLVDSHGRLRL